MSNVLELREVSKTLGSFRLKNASFTLPEGFIMGFIGPNGAGKTTSIKLILNMLKADNGEIKVFGKENISCEREIKERVGVVMDKPFYVDEWTAHDIERALSAFYRKWDSKRFISTLRDFEIDPKKKVKELSRGMSMKLMISAALSHDADLLILDEPTSGLDAVARNELMDILRGFISNENKAVLFSTHISSDLEKTADYITFINKGELLFTGTKDNLLEKYCVIKGGTGVLSDGQKKQVYGYREHSVGFDGLIETVKLGGLPKTIIAEPAGLDEIMVNIASGSGI